MPAEDHKKQKKIQCWVSLSTWQQLEQRGYNSPTLAVTEAFKKLLENPHIIPNESPQDPEISPQNPREIPVLNARLEEQEKLISFLTEALDKAGQREEDLKNMHNNYFLQVQTLINQKAISTPSKVREESKPAARNEESKPQIEKICKYCGKTFTAARSNRLFCSGKCKTAYYRKKKSD